MNVKQGDLAIIVKSMAGNEGKVCKVLKFSGIRGYGDHGGMADFVEQSWLCEFPRPIKFAHKGWIPSAVANVPDAWLRPISGIPDEESTDTNHPIKEPV